MAGGATSAAAGTSTIDPVKLLNRHKWLLAAAAVTGGLLGAGANQALEKLYPLWKPIALFQCSAQLENVGQSAGTANPEEMNRFMQTQIKIMTSDTVIGAVVDDPRLQSQAPQWSKFFMKKDPSSGQLAFNQDKALKWLRDDVAARVYPNTTLIELSYSYRYPEDATAIVGLVREKYMAELRRQGDATQDDRTRSIRDTLDRIQREVDGLQTRRKTIIDSERLESLDERLGATQLQVQRLNDEVVKTQQDLTATASQRNSMMSDLNNPEGSLFSDDIKQEAERDPTILDLRTSLSRMEAEQQSMLNNNKTTEHREYKALTARIAGAKQNLDAMLIQVQRKLFDGQLDRFTKLERSLKEQETKLNANLAEARNRLVALTRLQAEISDIDRQIENLLKTKADNNSDLQKIISLSQLASFNRVIVYQQERIPKELSFPQLKFMIPLGILLGIGAIGGLVVVREIADQRVKGPGDIALMPRMKLLGWIPDASEDPEGKGAPETAFRDRPKGVVAESYRQLRSALSKRIESAGHRTILVMSGMPGAGATSVVTNLALALAAADQRVLVIDANLRRPTLHRVLGMQESPGLADMLTGKKQLDSVVQRTSAPNVDFLAAGSKELRIVERLAAAAKGELLAQAKAAYDVVLIDVAPAVVAGDGIALAHRVDASILVVRAMSDKRGMIARIRNELADAKSDFLGVVVNGVRSSSGGYMRGNIRTASEYAKET